MADLIPLDRVVRRQDARAIDMMTVNGLAESIAEIGLLCPIIVRHAGEDRWEIVAGVHRVEAHKKLGLTEIRATVIDDDDLHTELAMIDENLFRSELSAADKAKQIYRRKEIYEVLHPETRHGAVGGGHDQSRKLCDSGDHVKRFSEETARITGQSERVVQLHAERGAKVIDEVVGLIRGTKLDTGSYLDKIKNLPPNEQYTAAKRDLSALRAEARDAKKAVAAKTAKQDFLKKVDAWREQQAHEMTRNEAIQRLAEIGLRCELG